MQIGVVGLGRMGGNISRRLIKAGHQCVVFDANAKAREALAQDGARPVGSLAEVVKALDQKPRAVWVMLPAGAITEETIEQLGGLLGPEDIVIDGGNSYYKDDIRRAKLLAAKRIHYVDCGTSGGVWGLERGYCMMIGGPKEVVDHLDPIFAALAPGLGEIPRTPGREKGNSRAERGYIHAGPSGAGHFVKMVHNGIEYGLMQAYAEGFDILRNKHSKDLPEDERFELNVMDIAEVWRRGSVVSSWLLDLGAAALAKDPALEILLGIRPGFRRGPLDDRGRDRGSGSGRGSLRGTLCPLPLAPRAHLRGKGALGDALRLRRPCRGRRPTRAVQAEFLAVAYGRQASVAERHKIGS